MDPFFAIHVHWYDGASARRHEGTLDWDATTLTLVGAGDTRLPIDVAALRFVELRPNSRVYALHPDTGFRIVLPSDIPPTLERLLPQHSRYGAWVDRFGLARAAVGFATISAVVVGLVLTAPEWLGPRVPESWERRMGDALVGDFGNRTCRTPAADRALAKLVQALDPQRPPVRVAIANIDMVNAVALPGGQVLLFDGIVQEAQSPEEIAGVLAHEVGHVRERHVMTAVLRQFGLSILLSGANSSVANGALGVATMGYSRSAEREADAYARTRMAKARVSPIATAAFFERMAEDSGEDEDSDVAAMGWVASHPSSLERAKAFRASARKDAPYAPALTTAEFAALKAACKADKDVEPFDLF